MEQAQLEKYGIQVGECNKGGEEAAAAANEKKTKTNRTDESSAPSTPELEEPTLTGEAYEGLPSRSTTSLGWWVNAKFQWGGLVGSKRERSADVPKNNKRGKYFHSPHSSD
jgi:Pin2-interacting protein X1